MLERLEPLDGPLADALGRAVRRDQLGMLGLQLLQPLDEPIILEIADLRCRLDVVLPVVIADFLAEPGNFGGRIGGHRRTSGKSTATTLFPSLAPHAPPLVQPSHPQAATQISRDAAQGMRNQTEELQRAGARVAELVQIVGGHVNHTARPERMLAIAFQHDPAAFEHEDFMFVSVRVFGGVAAGGDLELPHGETRRGIVGADQAAHAAIRRTFGRHRRGFNLFALDDFHGESPPPPIIARAAAQKNPEATTPSTVSASNKEAQTVVDPEVVTAQRPESRARHPPSITCCRFLSIPAADC